MKVITLFLMLSLQAITYGDDYWEMNQALTQQNMFYLQLMQEQRQRHFQEQQLELQRERNENLARKLELRRMELELKNSQIPKTQKAGIVDGLVDWLTKDESK